MSMTTVKRIQVSRGYYVTVEDTNSEVSDTSGDGLTIREISSQPYPNLGIISAQVTCNKEVAVLLRDALNQLYPA